MRSTVFGLLVSAIAIVCAAAPARAQGSFFTSLSGTVVDSSGGVIPGADVKIKNTGTGAEFNTVSASDGGFTVPSLPGGTYSVTVSLMGFKTATLNEVTLNAAIPATVKVVLSVGALEENVTVTGDSALVVQTQTPSIATNLTAAQITSLPLTSRNALDSLTSLPGFNTSGTARNSTVNGLPKSAINITLDGMNIQDNYLKTSDGYFARLTPTLDSVEEVTVTTAGNTADATGQGGVQIKFVTKSGTNSWIGTAYEYLRHDALNANTWFNNRDLPPDPITGKAPKPELRDYQQGIAQGGPIMKNKAFFFFNYEEERRPAKGTLQRVVLTQDAANGIFSYNSATGVRQVNLLQLAAANGQLATLDPTVAKLLGDIRSATGTTGSLSPLSNPLVQQYTFQTPTNNFNPAPTVRLDYDVSQNHRLTGSMNYRHINSTPDTTNNAQVPFPGFPQTGSQQSTRWTTSESLRSTLGSNLVNEARVGGTGGATLFSPELSPSLWQGSGLGQTNGYRLDMFNACCGAGFRLTNPNTGNTATSGGAANGQSREASTWVAEDTATYVRGRHSVTFGGSLVQADVWIKQQTIIPTATFGVLATESASQMFTGANFPGASQADITQAQNLYAMLTGRINSVTGTARINPAGDTYVPLGESTAQGRMREFDFYAADQWRASTNLTVSAGLRYVLSLPFYPTNNSYTTVTPESLCGVSGLGSVAGCNLFQPGVASGARPNYVQYPAGAYAYNVDRNNLAPSIGLAYQVPAMRGGVGRAIFGAADGDSVLRGGFALAYQRPGMSDFTGVFGNNQGILQTLQRDNTNTALPILLRNNPALPDAPAVSYPIATNSLTNILNAFDSNLQIPYTQSYTVGWQRKLGRDTALEIRYVGSRHRQDWETIDLNEPNIATNGFVNEFRKAQANLQANIAAGRGATFAYTGAPGTSPLPIFLAYFDAQNASKAGDAALYTGPNWTNANFLGYLAAQNPNPFGFMCNNATGCTAATIPNGLLGNTTFRANAGAAGLPSNFFVANPDALGGALLTTNVGGTRYNSMQFEVRKRFSDGLQYSLGYAWGQAYIAQRYGLQKPTADILQTGQVGGVQHAFKTNWIYELPFGREQRWASSGGALKEALVGGWSIDGVARIQTGEMLDFGNVRLVGMSVDEFRKAVGLRYADNGQVYILPDDIIQNTVRAFNVSATSQSGYSALGTPQGRYLAPANGPDCIETSPGYGDCGVRSLVVNGPPLVRFDIGASKRVKIHGPVTFEFRAEMLNAFNKPYFNPGSTAGTPLGFTSTFFPTGNQGPVANNGTLTSNTTVGTSADSFRLTQLLGVDNNTARIVQLVWRVRW
jgi:Carboxypeptidase regulatory-like domain/TonB-dependent Receptor Plug Domain